MKRMNKALASMIMAGTVCAAMMAGPVSAGVMQDSAPDASKLPAGTLIYSEDFEGKSAADTDKALELLGWKKAEGLRTFTMRILTRLSWTAITLRRSAIRIILMSMT